MAAPVSSPATPEVCPRNDGHGERGLRAQHRRQRPVDACCRGRGYCPAGSSDVCHGRGYGSSTDAFAAQHPASQAQATETGVSSGSQLRGALHRIQLVGICLGRAQTAPRQGGGVLGLGDEDSLLAYGGDSVGLGRSLWSSSQRPLGCPVRYTKPRSPTLPSIKALQF